MTTTTKIDATTGITIANFTAVLRDCRYVIADDWTNPNWNEWADQHAKAVAYYNEGEYDNAVSHLRTLACLVGIATV